MADIFGTAGSDNLECGAGSDNLYGLAGNDELTLRDFSQPMGSNTLDGGAGNDKINIYAGDAVLGVNTFIGGDGDDHFYIFCLQENFTAGQHFVGGSGFDRISVQMFGGDMTGAIIDPSVEGIYYPVTDDLKLTAAQADVFVEIIAKNMVVTTAGVINLGDATRLPERITLTVAGTVLNMSGANAYEFVQVFGSAGVDTITGTARGDHISGGDGADVLDGDGDSDNVWGEGGNDSLAGGAGDDYLGGGDGADTLHGGDGADILDGGAGVDAFFGGAGSDTIRFEEGGKAVAGETVSGGAGLDRLIVYYQDADLTGLTFAHDIEVLEVGNITIDADDLSDFNEIHASQITIVSAGVADLSGALFYVYEPIVLAVGGISLDVSLASGAGTPVDVTGSAGVDHITGGRTVVAGGGADVLTGDTLGNKYNGGDGADTITGGAGNDQLRGGAGSDVIDGGDDKDEINGDADNDLLSGGGDVDIILGAEGDDIIEGGLGDDELFGDTGSDTVSYAHAAGAVGVDLLIGLSSGADGADTLAYFENVTGSAFDDVLIGNSGVNVLQGGDGDDIFKGGAGADTLNGGAGADAIDYRGTGAVVSANFATGVVTVGGQAPEDTLISIEGILAGSANDTLIGSAAANWLSGGEGDDYLKGGAGADRLEGGDGVDTVDYSDHSQSVTLTLLDGDANVTVGKAAADTLTDIENVTGGSVRDLITGDANDNELLGGGGSDGLSGGGGNDLLDGGAGADTLAGGLGDDTFIVDHIGDKATESYGSGTDTVEAAVSWVLGANLENLTLTGTAINGSGNGLNNTIVGNYRANVLIGGNGDDVLQGGDGADRMDGGAGADTMEGGLGNDTYIVSNTLDTLVELVGEGIDIIESRVAWTLADNFENLTLTGTSHVAGTGNSVANTVLGNDGNNLLSGLGGADRLEGNAGADTLVGGDGADILDGGSGLDVFTGGAGVDRFLFDEPDMAGLTAASADRITDFAGVDRIGLTDLDANTTTVDVDDAFSFIGTGAFTGVAGQLRYEQIAGNTLITGDTNGDGVADFMIRLDGLHTLSAGHFFL